MIEIALDWPPTVNTYWRHYNGGVLISKRGRQYRKHVAEIVLIVGAAKHLERRLSVRIDAFPPDRRKRDLDNLPKAILDALQKAGVFEDDSQVDDLRIVRQPKIPPAGQVLVTIEEIE